jgi:hypothetical protein
VNNIIESQCTGKLSMRLMELNFRTQMIPIRQRAKNTGLTLQYSRVRRGVPTISGFVARSTCYTASFRFTTQNITSVVQHTNCHVNSGSNVRSQYHWKRDMSLPNTLSFFSLAPINYITHVKETTSAAANPPSRVGRVWFSRTGKLFSRLSIESRT